jgi:exonuclease III
MAQKIEKIPLNILSFNARGLNNNVKKDNLFFWLSKVHKSRDKIIFLQETHMIKSKEWKWNKSWPGKKIFSNGTSTKRGVAILMPKDLKYDILEQKLDDNGRYIALKIKINDMVYGIINGYAPTSDKLVEQMEWLKSITEILENLSETNIIFGGDINDGLNVLDKFNLRKNWVPSEYVLGWKEICAEYQLADIWRILNPKAHKYTWKQGTTTKNLRRSRLDFWLISTGLMYGVNNVSIEPGYMSDHSLIALNFFKPEEVNQGPSFWKFNVSVLKDKEYTTKTTQSIKDFKLKYNDVRDHGLRWDLIKMDLRRDAISYSKYKAKKNRDNFKTLLEKQKELEDKISQDPSNETLQEAERIKEEIEEHNSEKARGAKIRSKAEWVEDGEKNTKFFLTLENKNRQVKNITMLVNDDDEIIKEQEKILEEELRYYRLLYTQPTSPKDINREEVKQYFIQEEIPHISEEDKQLCEAILSYEEIGRSLKELKNGKTPGVDGFPPEFYKFFWKDVGSIVFDSLRCAETKKEMSIDQRRGVINLIPKQDKDIRRLKNWRPISLLNTDYKILTKALATRLKMVLPSVIHPDQVAYLKGRYIGQNIRTIIDVMDYTKQNNLEGIIAFLDFEKAFDSINWQVIDEALEAFNIGVNFRKWVKVVYKNISSCVTNCGYSSEYFEISRGVRQGCPLSAYLFIVVAEVLAIKIRNNKDIKGIKIGDTEIKVIQMADDTTNFIQNEESLQELLNTVEKFYKYSGLKLNLSKCEALNLGQEDIAKNDTLGLKWVKEAKALGIHFSNNGNIMYEKNFSNKLKELKRILAIWGQRDLSILGRIMVFKSLALSKVIYQCNNLTVPDDFISELDKLAFNFIWQYKQDKVKRTAIIADFEKGGLRMIDVPCFIKAQKVMWVKRLLKTSSGSWKAYPNYILEKLLGESSFYCNTNLKNWETKISPFYMQLLEIWGETKEDPKDDPIKLRREVLWRNKNIKINKKEILYKEWYNKGVLLLHDLLKENGDFKTLEDLNLDFHMTATCMEYNALKSAIPNQWRMDIKKMKVPKHAISNEEQAFIVCNNRTLSLSIAVNQDAYWEFVTKKMTKPIAATKWCTEFKIDEEQWTTIFKNYANIKDTKLKSFQFKVLNNLLPCNLYLRRIGKSDTDKCPKCNLLEDITHYLSDCPDTRTLWQQLSRWWKGITKQEIELTTKDVIIGLSQRTEKIIMRDQLNEIIMTTKWKIHANNQLGEKTCLYQILYNIKNMLQTQKCIANKNSQMTKYDIKWSSIEEHLT